MEIKRKIQFGAAAVIANSLLALSALAPLPALANPCANQVVCPGSCPTNLSFCQLIAQPGCTATSQICGSPGIGICAGYNYILLCRYQ
jgi:hypothetical protein